MNTILFGARLREVRKRMGLTQYELADMMGTHQGHISRYERGHCLPMLWQLVRLRTLSGASLDALVDEVLV